MSVYERKHGRRKHLFYVVGWFFAQFFSLHFDFIITLIFSMLMTDTQHCSLHCTRNCAYACLLLRLRAKVCLELNAMWPNDHSSVSFFVSFKNYSLCKILAVKEAGPHMLQYVVYVHRAAAHHILCMYKKGKCAPVSLALALPKTNETMNSRQSNKLANLLSISCRILHFFTLFSPFFFLG